MSRKMIILALLVVTFAPPAAAVDTLNVTSPDPILEKWRWTEFDRSSGLAGGVRDIFEDRDGNILPIDPPDDSFLPWYRLHLPR